MKKSYAKTLALVPLFALSACNIDRNNGYIIETSTPDTHTTNTIDTMRVIGVFNVTVGFTGHHREWKHVKCVDKNNRTMEIVFDVGIQTKKNDVAYAERGDTILMNGSMFVKNITQERLQSEFVKGR